MSRRNSRGGSQRGAGWCDSNYTIAHHLSRNFGGVCKSIGAIKYLTVAVGANMQRIGGYVKHHVSLLDGPIHLRSLQPDIERLLWGQNIAKGFGQCTVVCGTARTVV